MGDLQFTLTTSHYNNTVSRTPRRHPRAAVTGWVANRMQKPLHCSLQRLCPGTKSRSPLLSATHLSAPFCSRLLCSLSSLTSLLETTRTTTLSQAKKVWTTVQQRHAKPHAKEVVGHVQDISKHFKQPNMWDKSATAIASARLLMAAFCAEVMAYQRPAAGSSQHQRPRGNGLNELKSSLDEIERC